MKWLVQAVFIWCFANLASGGVLKCGPDSQDAPCTGQQQDLVAEPPVQVLDSAKEDKNAECQAGSEWESNCHYCRCSDDGVAECLKQDTCIAEYGDPILCKPNTTFLRGCNTCVCLETGLGLCTVETCTRSAAIKTELPQGRSCLPDTFWKSKCNDCGCSPEGEAYCTKKACPGLDTEPDMECAPGTVWKNDCNNCHCSSDGHTLCTLIECEISSFNNVPTTSRIGNLEDFKSDGDTTTQTLIDDEDYLNSLQTESPVTKPHEASESNNPKSEIVKVENLENLQEADEKVSKKVENYEVARESETEPNGNSPKDDIELIHNVNKRSTCKPNEDFQIDCNSCKCSADGQSYSCTENECVDKGQRDMTKEVEVFMESEGEDHIERHSVCKPRSTFYIGCNTCHCNLDGTDYSCTNKPCPLPEDVELFHELRALKSKPAGNATKAIVCVANRMFIMDCNTCWCNEDGTSFFCTRRVCIPEEIEEDPDKTENGTVISRGVRQVGAKEVSSKPKNCQPGKEFRLDCNKCLCDTEGIYFSCTRIDCSAPNAFPGPAPFDDATTRTKREAAREVPSECSPGSVFDQDCNVCRCTEDGKHAMCTMNRCPKPQDKTKPQESEGSAPATESTFRCNPGESYKRECNDCSCAADGQSIFCTLRYCD